jgi:hypothetical protein
MSPPTPSPSLLERLRNFDPTVLPILVAAVVLVGAVIWLLGRPLPTPAPATDARSAEQIAALRADLARLEGLGSRVAALEGVAQRLAALEARPATDLGPLQQAMGGAERQAAALEERLAAVQRDLAARPAIDANAFAPRGAVADLGARVETLARDQQAGAAQAQQRAAAAEQAIAGFAGRLAATETALAARTQAIEAQASRVGALEQQAGARIAALEQQVSARIAALEGQLGQRAQAIEAQAARIAGLEAAGQRLTALEGRASRMAALDAVRSALDTGRPLGEPLRALANPPEALTRFATAAPPTEAALRLTFEDAARAARAASEPPQGSGVLDSAVSRLSGLVTVRRGEEVVFGDAANAEIERARRALEAGDLEGSLRFLQRLSPQAREAMRGWLGQAEALVAARAALRRMAAG